MSRINTNIPSLQAMHRLVGNQGDLALRLERLSSGLRINRGKDDPAGLIASESLRYEIRGISQAIDNSSRAINVIATAEGALNEVSALLLDIRALVTQSANEGALSDSEIAANQLQIDSVLESIDRIANTTQFNGEKLLNGNLAYQLSGPTAGNIADYTVYGARIPEGSTLPVVVEVTASAQFGQLKFTGAGTSATNNITLNVGGVQGSQVLSFAGSAHISAIAFTINSFTTLTGVSATVSGTGGMYFNSVGYGSNAFVSVETLDGTFAVTGGDTATRDAGVDPTVLINGQVANADGLKINSRSNGLDLSLELTSTFGTALNNETFGITGGGALFQLGPNVEGAGQVSIGIPSVTIGTLGNSVAGYLSTLRSGGANELSSQNYGAAEDIVNLASEQIAVLRGRLGGFQANQLETNIRSQQVALENVKASESAIRDADYAAEIAQLTRAQILVQSTTSILGLANQLPQNVLALLG